MIKKFTLISAIIMLCVAGCAATNSAPSSADTRRIDTPAGMAEHLNRQNLPALESVSGWQNDYGPGLRLVTEHYEVYTTLLDPLILRQVPGFLESAYRGYNSQLPRPIQTETKFAVYLFADRQQWEDFTNTFAGRHAPMYCRIKAGAYYLNGACVVYNIGRERTFSVLGHEGWHQFNSRHFKFRLPSWLDEGIAMLFETSRYERGRFYFEPGQNLRRLGSLRKTLLENNMIPLRELIALNPGEVLISDQSEALAAFYCQSYALVRFLREEDYGKRLANYHRLLLDGLKGTWPLSDTAKRIAADRNIPLTVAWNRTVSPMLFAHYIGGDFQGLDQQYRQFCRKTVYHVRLKPMPDTQ
ncbi:MAG: hypothetical protein ACYTEL_08070 [Planctomycetota bacterium]